MHIVTLEFNSGKLQYVFREENKYVKIIELNK